jgi:hypothetical protein
MTYRYSLSVIGCRQGGGVVGLSLPIFKFVTEKAAVLLKPIADVVCLSLSGLKAFDEEHYT